MMLKRTGALWGRLSRIKGLIHGLITQIEDPNGNLYNNTNDGAGNLVTYRDPTMTGSQGVTYTYNTTHGLLSIKDPTGHTPVRNDYSTDGRLTASTDAFGNVIHYTYNLDANSMSVTDRAGKPTQYLYDNRGNVIQKTEYLNGVPQVSVYTYDQYDNKTSEQLPGAVAPTTFIYADTNNPPNPRLLTMMIVPNPNGNGAVNLTTSYSYDGQGHVLTTIDPRGIQTTNTYDPKGNLSTSQVTGYPAATYSYDANGNLIKETDPNGCLTTYLHDQSGAVTMQITADGAPDQLVTAFTYDANGNRTSETKQNTTGNQTTIYQPDAKGRPVSVIYPDGTSVLNTYDSLGNLVGTRDQNLRNKTIFPNAMGQPATVEYNFDNTREITGYDANGRPATVTDRGGRTTITKYDDLGRPTTVTYQDGSRTITTYDGQGRVTDSYDENNNQTHFTYDDAGRKLSEMVGSTQETDYTYDANGNVKTVTVNGHPYITGTTYNNLSLPTEVDYADGTHTTTEYDNVGNKTAFTDQAGKRTEYQRNCGGALVEVRQVTTNPGGTFSTDYKMDAVGNPVTQIDANSHATSYSWNNMNRRTSRKLPDGRTENYTSFDGVGNLTGKTDFANNSFTYGYDNNDHMTFVTGPGISRGYTFDAAMYRVVMNDVNGPTTFHHDERNRETQRISSLGTYNYTPHLAGGVEGIFSTNTNGTNVAYGYDALNRAATVVEGANATLLHYDTVGNLDKVTFPIGVTISQGYDTMNRLNAVTVVNGGGVIARYNYTLGAAGNRTGVSEYTGRSVTWIPDDLYRLTTEQIITDPAGNTGTVGYSYDPVGNRNQRTSSVSIIGMQNFTGGYDAADRLKPTYSFDDNGNQLTDGVRAYQYNALNQLTRVTGPGVDISYLYDGDGLRVQKTNNLTSVTTKYFWDDQNPTGVPQVLEELEGGQVARRYVYGPNGPLYQVQNMGVSWVASYFGRDTQSIRFLMDGGGNVTDTLTWDSYGRLISRTGATPLFLGYQSEYTEPETGLVYLRARWYNPDLGRFMGMDTYEGDQGDPRTLHKYVAFACDPQDKSDPNGNEFESSFGISGGFNLGVGPTGSRIGELLKGLPSLQQRMPVWFWSTSDKGKLFIKSYEGLVLHLYDDGPPGDTNATIGWGHLVHYGAVGTKPKIEEPFRWGITGSWAEIRFGLDVQEAERGVRSYIHAQLYQNEYDSLVSLVFNAGSGSLQKSYLRTVINQGKYDDAPPEFRHVGKQWRGLVNRRVKESWIFRDNVYINNR